jgi:hypothetical protein
VVIRKVSIKGFCVLKKSISISMSTLDHRDEVLEELKKIKGESQKFVMESSYSKWNGQKPNAGRLDLKAKIQSISVTEPLSFSLHTGITKFLLLRIYEIRESAENIELKFFSMKERRILHLLDRVAERMKISPEEALYKVTSFRNKSGKAVEGKRNIFDLSESHKSVAADKLAAMLVDTNKTGKWTAKSKQPVKPENILT